MQKREEEQTELFDEASLDHDSILANLGELGSIDARRWPQRLTEMIAVVESALCRLHSVEPLAAQRQAQDAVVAIARLFGGHQIYLPFGRDLERAIRDNRIWREFNGTNVNELADAYKLSTVAIYEIIARQRKLHIKKIQGTLFEDQS